MLSPENGSFASVAPREAVASGCIDASTATSGPHVFAVRFELRSSIAASASTASPSHVRDDRERPSEWDGMSEHMPHFSFLEKRNIFDSAT